MKKYKYKIYKIQKNGRIINIMTKKKGKDEKRIEQEKFKL